MAFNGSGVFVRLYNWVNDAASNIKIRADRMDNEMDGFATGLSTTITKNGQTTITANLPMATFRHTGVGDAVNRTDYTSAGQTQDGKLNWVAAGGTADAITAAYTIPITTLVDGQLCFVRAGAANATATPTFAPSGLPAHTITKNGAQALAAGDIFGAGHELELRYKLASTIWELMNPAVVPAVNITGNAATATKLATARTIAITGDLAYTSPSFDGSANVTAAGTLATVNSNVGSFTNATLTVNGKGLITAASSGTAGLTLGTATAFNSAATYAITSLPAGITEININFQGVTFNATSNIIFQIGDASGGLKTSGYLGAGTLTNAGATSGSNFTAGFGIVGSAAASVQHGTLRLLLVDAANFIWSATGVFGLSNATLTAATGGSVTLAAALDRITVTTVGGTAVWSAGKINISYR